MSIISEDTPLQPVYAGEHLKTRKAQRNIDDEAIEFVVAYGIHLYRSGAEFFFLGERQLPEKMRKTHARLIGTTVVVTGGEVATVYRNFRAVGSIRRKRESRWRMERPHRI